MRRRRSLTISGVIALFALSVADLPAADQRPVCRHQTLRVLLYPFVPAADALFLQLEAAFEAEHRCVDVQRVETYMKDGKPKSVAADYYEGGALAAEADVYELDTVLLGDAVSRMRPVTLPPGRFLAMAEKAATVGGRAYAVPHWVCGNFLFHRKGDAGVASARTWTDLRVALGEAPLMADVKGTSTLGEWYATALFGLYEPAIAEARLSGATLDPAAVSALTGMVSLCPAGYCRSGKLHGRTGVYPRLFARGQARAYVGYSESVYYALREIAEDCGTPLDGCLLDEEVAVRALPDFGPARQELGWVDAFAIPSSLSEEKRALAESFVRMATSNEAYTAVLTPAWPDPPRYLLPALRDPRAELGSVVKAGLYPALLDAFSDRATLNAAGSNTALRARGADLDCALPIDRDDIETSTNCKKVEHPK